MPLCPALVFPFHSVYDCGLEQTVLLDHTMMDNMPDIKHGVFTESIVEVNYVFPVKDMLTTKICCTCS